MPRIEPRRPEMLFRWPAPPPGSCRANNAMLSLALDGTGTLSLTPFVAGGGTVHGIVDISGYFE
jgi:hypothetical protein